MRKKAKIFLGLGIITLLFSGILWFVNAQEAEKPLTQGEFAIRLVKALCLDSGLTDSSPVESYIERLKEKGIKLEGEFQPDKIITKEEKSQLITKAFHVEVPIEEKPRGIFYRDRAIIVYIEGNVQVKLGGKEAWVKAEKDMKLSEDDSIRTGPKSLVDLNVGVAGRVRIKENTELLLKTLSTQAEIRRETVCLYLAMGEMIVDVNKVGPDSIFLTTTPTATVGVRGTIYSIKVTESKTEIKNP